MSHTRQPLPLNRPSSAFCREVVRYLILAGVVLVSACATPEWKQASAECKLQAYKLFPVVHESRRITEPVTVQSPDGTQSCISESVKSGDKVTTISRCTPNLTLQTRWLDRWIVVDLNEHERGIWLERCVSQLCLERFGNTRCESPSPR